MHIACDMIIVSSSKIGTIVIWCSGVIDTVIKDLGRKYWDCPTYGK